MNMILHPSSLFGKSKVNTSSESPNTKLHKVIEETGSKYIADGTISKREAVLNIIANQAIKDPKTSEELCKLVIKHPGYVVADVIKGITKDMIPESVLFGIGSIVQPFLDLKVKYVWHPLQEETKGYPLLHTMLKYGEKLDVHPFGNKKGYDEYTKQKAELTEQNQELSKALKEGNGLLINKLTSGKVAINESVNNVNSNSSNNTHKSSQEDDSGNHDDVTNDFVTDTNRKQVLLKVKEYLTLFTSSPRAHPGLKDSVDVDQYLDSLQDLSNQALAIKLITDYKLLQSIVKNQDIEQKNQVTEVTEVNEDTNELTSYMSCAQEALKEDRGIELEGIDDEVQSHEIVA